MSRRTNSATSRLRQDYIRVKKDPVPFIEAEPNPSNILEWHYVVTGPPGSPYQGGMYWGKLVFPTEFPFKPPAIYMMTPNGRFKTNTRLCLSISDYHPDTWNPAWSVATILTGLLSFMLEKAPTLGSIETSDYEKKSWAAKSLKWNLKEDKFTQLFPELSKKAQAELDKRQRALESSSARKDDDPQGSLRQQLERNQDGHPLQGAVTNFLVIGGFAAFAFIVQYVIQTISASDA